MSIWKDFKGVYGTAFTIGYGATNATFSLSILVNEDGSQTIELNVDRGINTGELPMRSSYRATNEDELCNLKTIMELLGATESAAYDYIDGKIKEITGGTTGGNVMLSPINLELDDIVDGESSFGFGTLPINKFIDRVIFEVKTPFFVSNPKTLQFSIGSSESSKEDIVPKFSIDTLQSTKVVNVEKTLTKQTEFYLFTFFDDGVEDPEEPTGPDYDPTFKQTLTNNHPEVSGTISSDADGDVVEVHLTGTDLTGSVLSTETFGEVTGNYMDFAVSIPMKASGETHYRIVQQNPALSYYSGVDANISNNGGIWTKDKEYTFPDSTGPSELLEFLLTESSGDTDYIHIYIYDLDSETPDQIIRTYHIKNELSFAAADIALLSLGTVGGNTLENLQESIFFSGVDEASMGITMTDDVSATVTLSGKITTAIDGIESQFPWLSDKRNVSLLTMECDASTNFKFRIYNPAMLGLETILDYVYVDDEGKAYCEGIVYAEDNPTGIVNLLVPVTPSVNYPIQVELIDPLTDTTTFTLTVNNLLTFDVKEPEESSGPIGEIVGSFNLPAETSETPTADQGSMKVRILSF